MSLIIVAQKKLKLHISCFIQDAFEDEFGSNKGIPQPNTTRWNSVLHSVSAVLDRGVSQLNRVMQRQGHSELKFTEHQTKILQELHELLLPSAQATDRLQGDKVAEKYYHNRCVLEAATYNL